MTSQWSMSGPTAHAARAAQAALADQASAPGLAPKIRSAPAPSGVSTFSFALLGCLVGLLGFLGLSVGCQSRPVIVADDLQAPYARPMVFAIAPLRNESGSRHADGLRLADDLTRRLERVDGIATVPVNRVLQAMQELRLGEVRTLQEALALRGALGVDGLVTGTVTAFDPYDPPELGMALDLFLDPRDVSLRAGFNARDVTYAAVDGMSRPLAPGGGRRLTTQPVSAVSGHFDAEAIGTRVHLQAYAEGQGSGPDDPIAAELTRIDMDRYARFVSYAMVKELMNAERQRLRPRLEARPDSSDTVTTASAEGRG